MSVRFQGFEIVAKLPDADNPDHQRPNGPVQTALLEREPGEDQFVFTGPKNELVISTVSGLEKVFLDKAEDLFQQLLRTVYRMAGIEPGVDEAFDQQVGKLETALDSLKGEALRLSHPSEPAREPAALYPTEFQE